MRIDLSGEWQLSYRPQRIQWVELGNVDFSDMPIVSALVPGNVELDLMRAGILPDLALGNNIYRLREFETYGWWHRRSFAAPAVPHRHSAQLVFEGLDCMVHVWLNGVLVGEGVNALVPQRFDVTDALREGENDLVVRIRSAVLEGRQHVPTPLESALPCGFESLPIRKAPHCYGWDIMPRAVSAGIWRDVYILPHTHNPAMWLIRWSDSKGCRFLNHYLAGERPFKLEQYRQWLRYLEIPSDIGSANL